MSGYEHRGAWDKHGTFKFRARVSLKKCSCPGYGSKRVIRQCFVDRLVHAPPIGLRRTVMFIETPRMECRSCGRVRRMPLPQVPAGKNHTKSFARLVVDLRKLMTGADVAEYLGVSDRMVRDIEKLWLKRHFARPRLGDLKAIAIDEFSIRKGHDCFTIVMDLDSRAVVFAAPRKGKYALKLFWKRLRSLRARIRAVATDMASRIARPCERTSRIPRWRLIDSIL